MALILLIGLSALFAVVGHSTLLHFRSAEQPVLPLSEVFMPRPRLGFGVSMLCYAVSLGFLVLGVVVFPRVPAITAADLKDAAKMFLLFIGLPVGCHAGFLLRRLRRSDDGNIVFQRTPTSRLEASIPAAIVGMLALIALVP